MKITREADYAMRIILMLARENKQIEAKTIAQSNGIPYRFTLKILGKIVQSGLIRSYRGVNGGYVLNCPPSEISMLDVIECIDGSINFSGGNKNDNEYACRISSCLNEIQNTLKNELKDATFDKIMLCISK